MKMKMNIKYLLVALATMTLATSCLDKLPESAIPTDEAMQSYNDAEQTVTGIYSMMKSGSLGSGALTLLPGPGAREAETPRDAHGAGGE